VDKARPFNISKREVWLAYKRVRENRGAAGVDDQTIAEFEKDLSNNLYRLWNRMSSGATCRHRFVELTYRKGTDGERDR
jgi:retron-type reverse transcriptase